MKLIISILLLLSISFNAQAKHEGTIEVDGYETNPNGIRIYVYNKSTYPIGPSEYLWWVSFDDNTKRKYRSEGTKCYKYSDCVFFIEINKKGINNIIDAH